MHQEELKNWLQDTRNKSIFLTAGLKTEDFVVQPIFDVSPIKWHLGHTSWFFETFILNQYVDGYELFHPGYDFLLNSYYDGVGEQVDKGIRGTLSRPSVEEIMQYRAHVDQQLETFFSHTDVEQDAQLNDLLELGIHHEKQHQELMMYDIKYIHGFNPLSPSISDKAPELPNDHQDEWLKIDEGIYEVGYESDGFHFDNEKGRHKKYFQHVEIMNRLVTNREFMAFIADGGYDRFSFWLYEGWHWVQSNKINSPLYWFKLDGDWYYYTMHGIRPVDPDVPVSHVSYYEADAFARWKGMRLPTEFEWEVAANAYDGKENGNFQELEQLMPLPANGRTQFYGELWEWTQSAYLPYPRFKAAEGAVGEYNGKFMINQMVLRGGSHATPQDHIRSTYRNFFQADRRWLFSGFRLAREL